MLEDIKVIAFLLTCVIFMSAQKLDIIIPALAHTQSTHAIFGRRSDKWGVSLRVGRISWSGLDG